MEFSAEKVLKNRFSKKFRGIFRGKSLSAENNVRKIGPWISETVPRIFGCRVARRVQGIFINMSPPFTVH
jgi:hypothetical protein